MVPLDSLGAGLLRDLEGVATDAISQSDLAFHALREYVPGDDLRHVHWRSSAKAMGSGGENQLLVRQYLDTRRSHATIVVDDGAEPGPTRTIRDRDVGRRVDRGPRGPRRLRDLLRLRRAGRLRPTATSRSTLSAAPASASRGLIATAQQAARMAPDTSLLFLVSGPAPRR